MPSELRRVSQHLVRLCAECLDWLPIVNRRHLERVLRVVADHGNSHRPHGSLKLKPPIQPPESCWSVPHTHLRPR